MHKLQRVVAEAPAKINLFLEITGRREDGYHLIDTVMQAVSLTDIVVVGRRREPGVRVTCSRPGIPEDAGNLAHRAAAAFRAAMQAPPEDGLHIHIDKRIPHEAGLGGGSADAAAVLVGLDRLYGLHLGRERLRALALPLGADVPFAVLGGCARARGIGEELSALPPLPPCQILIAKPAAGVSTREAYALYDSRGCIEARPPGAMLRALESGALAAAARSMHNVFESVIPAGETAAIKSAMAARGALGSALSGSGSAVAGLFADGRDAAACAESLAPAVDCLIAAPVGHGARVLHES